MIRAAKIVVMAWALALALERLVAPLAPLAKNNPVALVVGVVVAWAIVTATAAVVVGRE